MTGWIFSVTPPPAQAAQLWVQHTKPLSPSEPPPPPEPNLFVHTSSSQSPSNLSLFTIMPPDLKQTFLYFPLRTQCPEKFTIAGSWQLGRCTGLRIAVSSVALCLVCNALFAQFLHEFTQAWHYGVTTCLISANFSAMELQITSSTCNRCSQGETQARNSKLFLWRWILKYLFGLMIKIKIYNNEI